MRPEQTDLRVTTNRGGARVFMDLRQLREFSIETARDVATLTAIVEASEADESFIKQTLGLLNDLSFQLQQAVELICGIYGTVPMERSTEDDRHV
jgi:hypothetical protein